MKRLAVALCLLAAGCAAPPPVTTRSFADNREFALVEPMAYEIGASGVPIQVPAGFVTDYASIPREFWSLLSPHGRYSRAAVVHDFLYWSQLCSQLQADNLFMIAMKESQVPWTERTAIYEAVRLRGHGAWEENRQQRAQGLPKVIPATYMRWDGNATWPEHRRVLVRAGVKDPSFGVAPANYCAAGDSPDVPGKPLGIRPGMTEAEVLSIAGQPDRQADQGGDVSIYSDRAVGARRTWTYLPTAENAYVTTVTFAGGRVADVKREKKP